MRKTGFLLIVFLFFIALSGCGLFVKHIPSGQIPDKTPLDNFIKIDGVNFHYREYPGNGPNIFLLHGLPSSMYTWQKVAPILNKQGYHVWMLDMKGFGWSDKPKGGDYEAVTISEEVNKFLEAKGLSNLIFVGNSFGGGVATLIAVKHPDKISKLVLVDAAAFPQKLPMVIQLGRIPCSAPVMKLIYGKWMIKWNLAEVVYSTDRTSEEQVEAYYTRICSEGGIDALVDIVNAIDFNKFKKYTDRVNEIKIPTFIIWGDTDRWVPISNGYQFRTEIKDSKFLMIDKCGHMPQEELPELTAQLILDFIEGRPIKETPVPDNFLKKYKSK